MSRKNRARVIVLVAIMLLAIVVYAVWTASGARADGNPSDEPVVTTTAAPTEPISDDPCFRQDPECYDQQVECANNVFVPLNADGTWTCPGEQLPEEQIGRAIDCPDGSVGHVVDAKGTIDCPLVIPPGTTPGPDQVDPGGSTPFTDCTDPLVECACDHYIGGCTGGQPPEGEGAPFPDSGTSVETASSNSPNTNEVDIFAYGALLGAGLGVVTLLSLYMIFKKDPNIDEAFHS